MADLPYLSARQFLRDSDISSTTRFGSPTRVYMGMDAFLSQLSGRDPREVKSRCVKMSQQRSPCPSIVLFSIKMLSRKMFLGALHPVRLGQALPKAG